MIFCTQCGTKNKDEAKFCRKCGASLSHDEDFDEEVEEIAKPQTTAKPTEENKAPKFKIEEPEIEDTPLIADAPLPQTEEYYEDNEDVPAAEFKEDTSAEEYYEEDPEPSSENAFVTESEDANEEYYEDNEGEANTSEPELSPIASNPANDSYWNDVVPEIEEEIYKIPKDIILKFVFGGLAIIVLVVVLICAL